MPVVTKVLHSAMISNPVIPLADKEILLKLDFLVPQCNSELAEYVAHMYTEGIKRLFSPFLLMTMLMQCGWDIFFPFFPYMNLCAEGVNAW